MTRWGHWDILSRMPSWMRWKSAVGITLGLIFIFHIKGILFRKSNLKLSSALMDQRTEKLCCTGSCMYPMSNIPCLRKMVNADKINTRPLLGYMSVCSDFPVKPSPIKPIFCFRVQNSSWFSWGHHTSWPIQKSHCKLLDFSSSFMCKTFTFLVPFCFDKGCPFYQIHLI